MEHKYCEKCDTTKPISQFTKHSKSKDGFYYRCKSCKNQNRRDEHLNKIRIRDYKREYQLGKERFERFIENNPNYFRDYQRKWRRENLEKEKERKKKYCISGKNAMYCQNRRSKLKSVYSDFAIEDWEESLSFFSNKCAYCYSDSKPLQMEHIVALNKGGEFIKQNIIPACINCNSSKQDSTLEEWFPRQSYYCEKRLTKIDEWRNCPNVKT